MNLAAVTARIRPRTNVEAMDLGVALVRELRWPLLRTWLVVFVPVAIAAWFAFKPTVAWAVVWWLKPLYDRVPLFVLSRALFGATPSFGQTLAALPRLLTRRIVSALTVRRFSPYRAFLLPVDELEGLRGSEAANRKAHLLDDARGSATWLLVWCQALEQCLWMAGLAIVWWYSPDAEAGPGASRHPFGLDEVLRGDAALGSVLAYFVAVTIAELVYVAAGFTLYLNRRTALEGWDVELAFRRIAARAQARRPAVRRNRVRMPGLLLAVLAAAPALDAQTASRPDPQVVIRRVLSEPEFATKEKVKERRIRESGTTQGADSGAGTAVAGLMLTIGWVCAGLLLLGIPLWLILREKRAPIATGTAARAAPPTELFGLDLRVESLPPDPAGEALRRFDAGDLRGALALLYRATLARLTHSRALALRISDTEGDCVRRVRALGDAELAGFFDRLNAGWQNVAYAHGRILRDEVASLCADHDLHVRRPA